MTNRSAKTGPRFKDGLDAAIADAIRPRRFALGHTECLAIADGLCWEDCEQLWRHAERIGFERGQYAGQLWARLWMWLGVAATAANVAIYCWLRGG